MFGQTKFVKSGVYNNGVAGFVANLIWIGSRQSKKYGGDFCRPHNFVCFEGSIVSRLSTRGALNGQT
jgi:hypothetical protein